MGPWELVAVGPVAVVADSFRLHGDFFFGEHAISWFRFGVLFDLSPSVTIRADLRAAVFAEHRSFFTAPCNKVVSAMISHPEYIEVTSVVLCATCVAVSV